MPDPRSRSQVVLDIGLGQDPLPAVTRPDTPFRIALLGNLRGHAHAAQDLAARRPVLVDRDDFDEVLASFAPELDIQLGEDGPRITVGFRELDDFHPDRLYERLPLFQSLRELRQRLSDPRSFGAAARELQGDAPASPAATAPAAPREGAAASVLDQILTESVGPAPDPAAKPAAGPPARDDLQEYLRRVVAPHLLPGRDPRQPELLAQVDATISDQMRALLHHPDFQALESLWRGVYFLVRRLETNSLLRLYLIDASQEEIAADLAAQHGLESTGLYQLLVGSSTEAPGADPWALLVGDLAFGPAEEEIGLLERLAQLAGVAGAPWLLAAHPQLVGLDSFATPPELSRWQAPENPAWEAFRRTPAARFIGLAAPRFLLRLPYGEDAEPCDAFDFEELPPPPVHEHYLWGNPALACALLLGETFSEAGWQMRPGMHREISGLPLHLVRNDGAATVQPCAETLLTERAAARLMDAGVMPLASMKEHDAVLLVRFQSVAAPLAALAGRWGAGNQA
ncbi:hypothetical protein BH23GEM7_BH23GEM7_12060 [soil metagenome]|nr:type VI secretion system contractile sheath large subunit [Gemmatimonadota bacterium]